MPTTRTPGSEETRYNFGPASSRDTVLFTAARPGNPPGDRKFDNIDDAAVREWIQYMKQEKGISHVLVLLDDNEMESYLPTGLETLYQTGGMSYTIQPMKAPGAASNIFAKLDEAATRNERVVAHCTGGVGRSGRVAAGWLAHRYGLTPEAATDEAMQQAIESGVKRKGNVEMLQAWLDASKKDAT